MRTDLSRAASFALLLLLAVPGSIPASPAAAQTTPTIATASKFDFYERAPYRTNIPCPETVIGYEAGATHTTFRDQERYIQAVAAAVPERVRVIEYGKSVQGRPLRLVIVSSPENIARLDAIRADIGKLADPRGLSSSDERTLLQNTPTITWLNHCIHGDETASFETFMWTLYTLTASDAGEVTDALKNSVVILNPVFNPDGHERYVVYYNSVAVGSPNDGVFEKSAPWAALGRGNHYRFDMNREKLAQSQPESRAETAAYLQWNPQVFVDLHGQVENYFFPPNSLPTIKHVDPARVDKWTKIIGRENAEAFDRRGWSFMNRETFDFFYPGYLDSFTTLNGAIGMTYETDSGRVLAGRRSDGTLATLRDGIAHHFEASLKTISTVALNREALLHDYVAFRREAIATGSKEKMKRVVIPPGGDAARRAELAASLLRVGVEVRETNKEFRSSSAHDYRAPKGKTASRTFPVGSLVIDLAQPQGHVARAFLDPEPEMEPEFIKDQNERRARNEKRNENERGEGYGFYDITAWALPLSYGVEAYWTEDTATVDAAPLTASPSGAVSLKDTPTGGMPADFKGTATAYLFAGNSSEAAVLALRLLQEKYRFSVTTKPIQAGGKEWPRGTLIARTGRNPEGFPARLAELSRTLGVSVTPLSSAFSEKAMLDMGSDTVLNLRRPRIAVAAGDGVGLTSFGQVWHLLDTAGIQFTTINARFLGGADLSRYNVLILPDGGYGALGKPGTDSLKAWARKGGVLVGLDGGGTWFTDKDTGISTATRVGADDKPASSSDKDKNKDEKAAPEPVKPLSLPGSIFRAKLDTDHFLGYGYSSEEIAVPLAGNVFLTKSKTGTNVVTFDKGPSLLSGFIWENNTEKLLANTAYVIDEPLGSGHALLYLNDPTFRSLWPGLRLMFWNGLLYGTTGSDPDED